MENFIDEAEIMHRIKMQKDVTEEDRDMYYFDLKIMQLSDYRKEKFKEPTLTNQQRNKLKKDARK